jgi:hypothetical protein
MTELDAGRLVGLLAEPARRAVVAALVLGHHDTAAIRSATALEVRPVAEALHRLQESGLVVGDEDGHWFLVEEAFSRAAAAAAPAVADEHEDSPESAARVLRAFVQDGRLVQIPSARNKRLVVLDLLAQEFEPGGRYGERQVNAILARWHPDVAALRRYLVDEGFLDRAGGEYWRSGGTVED